MRTTVTRHHLNWTLNAYKNADHWCVIQINSTQDQSSPKAIPEDARSYTGELWKIGGAKKIAKVSSSGKVTGVKKGTVTITATAKDGSKVKATCKIKVK